MSGPENLENGELAAVPPSEELDSETLRKKFNELIFRHSERKNQSESLVRAFYQVQLRNAKLTVSNELLTSDLKKVTLDIENLRAAIVDKNIRESQELWKIAALNEALDEWMKKYPGDDLCKLHFQEVDHSMLSNPESPWLQKARDTLDAKVRRIELQIDEHDRGIAMITRTAQLVDIDDLYVRTTTGQDAEVGDLPSGSVWSLLRTPPTSEEDLQRKTHAVCENFEQLQRQDCLVAQSTFAIRSDTVRVGSANKFLLADLAKADAELKELKADFDAVTGREADALLTVQRLKRQLADWKAKFPDDELSKKPPISIVDSPVSDEPRFKLPESPWRRTACIHFEDDLRKHERQKSQLKSWLASAKKERVRVDVDAEFARTVVGETPGAVRHASGARAAGNRSALEEESDEEVVEPERMWSDPDPSDEAAMFDNRDPFMDD